MKKLIIAVAIITSAALTSCVAPMAATQPNQAQQQAAQQNQAQDPMQTLLGGLANNAVAQADQQTGGNGFLGNLLASITGSVTTTQANLVGTWTYTEPCVQFESQNLLTQAGGTSAATNLENRLVPIYRMVGISAGTMVFNFAGGGQCTYTINGRTMNGTYVFDYTAKTVTITSTGSQFSITAYVTISGNNMSLCFDSSRVLSLFSSFGNQYTTAGSTFGAISAISESFSGMKTGFKFKR